MFSLPTRAVRYVEGRLVRVSHIAHMSTNGDLKTGSVAQHPMQAGSRPLPPRNPKPGSRGKVSVIGVGRLGLCWALNLERVGYEVLGVDIFPGYVKALNDKTLKTTEPMVTDLLTASKKFRATLDLKEAVDFSDTLYVLVQTPSTGGKRHYDCTYVARVLKQLNKWKVQNKNIVVGCTVMPGYCRTRASYLIRDCPGSTISYNPEFICQGDIINGQLYPDICLIGEGSKQAGDALEEHAREIALNDVKICRMSTDSAEIAKLSINCFVTTKISYANMIGDICDRTPNADKTAVLRAVGSDSRVGLKYLKPGYGYGGPCFPRDNRALAAHASEVGVDAKISKATDAYNNYHTGLQAEELLKQDKKGYTFSDVAYKTQCPVPIIEESQKLEIARIIARAGKPVTIIDRQFIMDKVQEEFGDLFQYGEAV